MHPLTHFSLIRITGADARTFLQGQLSNDLMTLTPSQSLLASCNSAQGRVQAILHLVEANGDILALLPKSMLSFVIPRLQKYILRAKARIEDIGESMRVEWGTANELISQGIPTPQRLGECLQQDERTVIRWPDRHNERYLVIESGAPRSAEEPTEVRWTLADIQAGLPQVLPDTHEEFVAQMLNLDALGAISFNKGCYTGQEIIARAHFRGTVKRRMFRFTAPCQAPTPGTKIMANGEIAGEVVMAAQDGEECELLAVISLAFSEAVLSLATTGSILKAVPLPYTVPTQS